MRPAWFYLGFAMPEPLVVAQMRLMAATTLFDVGVIAHAAAARAEVVQVLQEFRARVARGGVATPTLDRLCGLAAGENPTLPDDGAQTEPLRWGGIAALGAALTAPPVLGLLRHHRRQRTP